MANKLSSSRQHKHLAVLIDADNASVVIAENFIESNETVDKLRVVHPTHAHVTCCKYPALASHAQLQGHIANPRNQTAFIPLSCKNKTSLLQAQAL